MKATDCIKASLEMSHFWFMAMVDAIKDAPFTWPTPRGGNHPLWVLGHVTYGEAQLVSEFIKGEPHPLADWGQLFGTGSTAVDDAAQYPSIDDVLVKFEEVRAETLRVLSSLTDDDLDKPSQAPPMAREMFGTVGQCFVAIGLHLMFHGGQVADARRAAGRQPALL